MQLHWIDLSIIVLYLIATIFVGFWVSKRASKDMKSYFLGGNKLPWYMLAFRMRRACSISPEPCGWFM